MFVCLYFILSISLFRRIYNCLFEIYDLTAGRMWVCMCVCVFLFCYSFHLKLLNICYFKNAQMYIHLRLIRCVSMVMFSCTAKIRWNIFKMYIYKRINKLINGNYWNEKEIADRRKLLKIMHVAQLFATLLK